MSDGEQPYDYTEGASAIEINQVLEARTRRRRDSQVGSAYDDDGSGAVFGGPSAGIVPSSVSTMHYDRPWARRRSSDAFSRTSLHRRQSGESQRSGSRQRRDSAGEDASEVFSDASALSDAADEGESMGRSRSHTKRRSRRRASPESPSQSKGVFDNLASLFSSSKAPAPPSRQTSRRGSRISSRRSSIAISDRDAEQYSSGEERWGYSSAEEDGSLDGIEVDRAGSPQGSEFEATRPTTPTATLPLLGMNGDPFFGDTRIDIDMTSGDSTPPPPPGPPSRQTVVLVDEDMSLKFTGFEI
ncbi:hypothetical protein FRC00_000081, partial [Tulasnella sp. 408]